MTVERRDDPSEREFLSPDEARFVDPDDDPVLRGYLDAVLRWHGYARFLGLPHLKENPDVPIDRLFVEPSLSRTLFTAHNYPSDPAVESFEAAVQANPRLIVLGDPGSGKTTLVNFLSWQLARSEPSLWHDWMFGSSRAGRPLPVPLILRELRPRADVTFDKLLGAFCDHPMNRDNPQLGAALRERMAAGQAFFLVDGLDEVGTPEVRAALRRAVHEGLLRYRSCRWLLTSRVVGYDTVRFEEEEVVQLRHDADFIDHLEFLSQKPWAFRSGELQPRSSLLRLRVAEVRYVCPFSNEQIARFARHWYVQRDTARDRAEYEAKQFVEMIGRLPDTRDLARNPNLLTMMAIICRQHVQLPNGRALLYDKIAETYLESIDAARKLDESPYSFRQKRAWLARVGFEMQRRRSRRVPGSRPAAAADTVLATAEEVREWLHSAMGEELGEVDLHEAHELLDHLSRRSGLLVPRGTDNNGKELFAFFHLSFQEYFAASFLRDRILEPNWETDCDVPGARKDDLKAAADDELWRETLVFLFELLDNPRWLERLLNILAGEDFKWLTPFQMKQQPRARLVGHLAVDHHNKLAPQVREAALRRAVLWSLRYDDSRNYDRFRALPGYQRHLLGILFSLANSQMSQQMLDVIQADEQFRKSGRLILRNSSVSDLRPFQGLPELRVLDLSQTAVTDLGPIARQSALAELYLTQTNVTNLAPLEELTNLRKLGLAQSRVRSLRPLHSLDRLEVLDLRLTKDIDDHRPLEELPGLTSLFLAGSTIRSVEPLESLRRLQFLDLSRTSVMGIEPLAGLRSLRQLSLTDTLVNDVRPLERLAKLHSLDLGKTQVTRLEPLSGLLNLRFANFSYTSVKDFGPLADLPELRYLNASYFRSEGFSTLRRLYKLESLILTGNGGYDYGFLSDLGNLRTLGLGGCHLRDLWFLKSLGRLRFLNLSETPIRSVEGLSNLSELTFLDLNETEVADLRPLASLPRLSTLRLNLTQVDDLTPLTTMKSLRRLELRGTNVKQHEIERIKMNNPHVVVTY